MNYVNVEVVRNTKDAVENKTKIRYGFNLWYFCYFIKDIIKICYN